MNNPSALLGLRVLDLTQGIAGPFCTRLLADYGAEVLKIERPDGGDPARRMAPFLNDQPHHERSGAFLHLNTNKRGITLDLKNREGVNIFRRLVKDADLVVESYRPGTMRRFGLSYATLSRANRRLVMVSISNYGQTGPYRDYRGSTLTLEAIGSATMPWTGQAGKPPLKLAENASLYFAGLTAALGTVAAVMTARATGRGQLVDMSIVEALQASAESKSLQSQYSAEPLGRQANTARFPYLMGTYPCKDGYISLQGSGRGETWWPRIYRMMGMPELEQDPRFSTPEARAANRDEFDAMWYSWLADHTKQEVFAAARKFRFPLAPTNTPEDLVKDPHYNARGFFFEVEHPEMGHVKQPGRPFVMMGTPWRLTRTAPLLGQHNEEVYCGELGYSKGDLVRLRALGVV